MIVQHAGEIQAPRATPADMLGMPSHEAVAIKFNIVVHRIYGYAYSHECFHNNTISKIQYFPFYIIYVENVCQKRLDETLDTVYEVMICH